MTKPKEQSASRVAVIDIFTSTIPKLKKNFWPLLVVAVAPFITSLVLFGIPNSEALSTIDASNISFAELIRQTYNMGLAQFWLFSTVAIAINVLLQLVLWQMLLTQFDTGKILSPLEAFRIAWSKLSKFILVLLAYGLFVAFGLILFVIPAVLVIFFLSFSFLIVIDQDTGVKESFRASFKLSIKHPLDLGLVLLGAGVFAWAVLIATSQLAVSLGDFWYASLQAILSGLTGLYLSAVFIAFYFAIKNDKR